MNYKVPYDFVLKYLYPVRPKIKKMMGSYALLYNQKILMLLRDSEKNPEYNGVFIATQPEYYDQLQNEIHTGNMDINIDGLEHSYIFISEDLEEFNDKVKKACEMIKAGDDRIGK